MGESPPTVVLRVVPRAAVVAVGPWRDGILHVRVTRPAADGQATSAALAAVATTLGVSPSSIRLVQGARSRHKRVAVAGLTADQLAARLARLGDAPD